MECWDVRLVGASYKKLNDDCMVVELYGRTSAGNSITIRYYGFEPYFYIGEPTNSLIERLQIDPDVKRIEYDTLFYNNKIRPVIRIITYYPWVIPDLRNRYRDNFDVFSADIPFHQRFIYDMDLHSCIKVYGERTSGEYTTDLIVNAEKFEDIKPFNPNLKILSFDIETSIKHGNIYSICYYIEDDGEMIPGEPIYGDEYEIIEKFAKIIQIEDPDVITGYNINNFDIPKILERAEELGIEQLMWGRNYSDPKSVKGSFWRVDGRVVADAWWAVKTDLKPKRETLNFVSKMLFNEEKLDVNPANMDVEWATNRDKVLKYCLKDSELALKILDKIGTIRKTMDLASVARLPLADVQNVGNSSLIDSLLIREIDRNKIACPLTRRIDETEKEESIEGAYVHEMYAGLHPWVCVLDFKSMYPSIIINKNICFTTQHPDGEIKSPIGCAFLSSKKRMGILPELLKDLMNYRDEIKKSMKDTNDPIEKNYYDGLQWAVKIFMNAFYGVFASNFYRFTDKNIGGSVTGFAREITKGIIDQIEKMNFKVLYSDTDSVFISSPYNDLESCIKFGNDLAEQFSLSGITLQFEKLINPLFTHGKKKRYIGKVVWPENTTIVRGYEIRRTDSFDLQSDSLMETFNLILDGRPYEAVAYAREVVARTLKGDVNNEELVISKSCRSFSEYVRPESQASVQTAKKLIEKGYDFIPGMKVSWIVVDGSVSPQLVEPYIVGEEFKYKPDYKYYAKRLANTLSSATEAFGWTDIDLLQNTKQTSLEAWNERKERINNKVFKNKKTDEILTLEEFM